MVGEYNIVVETSNYDRPLRYEFTICRRFTVITGNSGTGKTSLYEIISDFQRNRGIAKCIVNGVLNNDFLTVLQGKYELELPLIHNQIVLFDEGDEFIESPDFARISNMGDFYIMVITRSIIKGCPYSVDDVLRIQSEYRDDIIINRLVKCYNTDKYDNCPFVPNIVITEDSKSAFTMIQPLVNDITIVPAGGKDSLPEFLRIKNEVHNKIFVLADGAAFGSVYRSIIEAKCNCQLYFCLPESFERVLLESYLFIDLISDELTHTFNYADSTKFLTWERYYTSLVNSLIKIIDHGTGYKKGRINRVFKTDEFREYLKNYFKSICDVNDSDVIEVANQLDVF